MEKLDFSIREDVKPIDEMTDEEIVTAPTSEGFWWTIEEGGADMFVELLADEETKKACYEAFEVIEKLENVVDIYIDWI